MSMVKNIRICVLVPFKIMVIIIIINSPSFFIPRFHQPLHLGSFWLDNGILWTKFYIFCVCVLASCCVFQWLLSPSSSTLRFDAFKYVHSCHGRCCWCCVCVCMCLDIRIYNVWCEIMTNGTRNESNGKGPIIYKFLTSCILRVFFFRDMMQTPEAARDILGRCQYGTMYKENHLKHTLASVRVCCS